jgi:hypothetical protein
VASQRFFDGAATLLPASLSHPLIIKDIAKAVIFWAGQNCMFTLARDATRSAVKGPFLVIAPHPDEPVQVWFYRHTVRMSIPTIACCRSRCRLHRKGLIACPVYEYPIWFWLRDGIGDLLPVERIRLFAPCPGPGVRIRQDGSDEGASVAIPKSLGGFSEGLFQPFSFRSGVTKYFSKNLRLSAQRDDLETCGDGAAGGIQRQ